MRSVRGYKPARARRHIDPADLDAVHHLVEALAGHPTKDLGGARVVVLEDQLGGVDALVAHLLDLARDRDALGGLPKPDSFSMRKVVMFL